LEIAIEFVARSFLLLLVESAFEQPRMNPRTGKRLLLLAKRRKVPNQGRFSGCAHGGWEHAVDSLRSESEVLRGASAVAPDFVREKERLRYERQAGLIKLLEKKSALRPDLTATAAHDILWTLTSYEIHRCLVVERKCSADRYEKWLGDTLVLTLLKPK
jgi:hypothetical protein